MEHILFCTKHLLQSVDMVYLVALGLFVAGLLLLLREIRLYRSSQRARLNRIRRIGDDTIDTMRNTSAVFRQRIEHETRKNRR